MNKNINEKQKAGIVRKIIQFVIHILGSVVVFIIAKIVNLSIYILLYFLKFLSNHKEGISSSVKKIFTTIEKISDGIFYLINKKTLKNLKEDTFDNSLNDFKKTKGNIYEYKIGFELEKIENSLVIYNGFIKGYKDKGVDIVYLLEYKSKKYINLIQCKNWEKMIIMQDELESIHDKLKNYNNDFFHLYPSEIKNFLSNKKDINYIINIIYEFGFYENDSIHKILYVNSLSAISDKIKLEKLESDLYRYKSLFILVCPMGNIAENCLPIRIYESIQKYNEREKILYDISKIIEEL